MDVFLYRQRLVGGVGSDQVGRKDAMQLCEFRVDGLAEFGDLLLIAHIDGDGDSATAAPVSVAVPPGVIVQVVRRSLVSATYIDEIAQVYGSACRGGGHNAVADSLGVFELPGRSEGDLALTGFEHAAWRDDVVGLNQ